MVGFKTPEAVEMWKDFKAIWEVSNPQSANYEFMQEPLQADEVWIAWDHTARLINAVKDKPDDFMLVPAPAGPKGRGFMPVIAGFAIPKGAPNRAGAEQLIEYLTQPQQQVATLRELAFFPVTNAPDPGRAAAGHPPRSRRRREAGHAKDALPSLLPIGLGAKSGEFNKVYLDTFNAIILKNERHPVDAGRAGQDPPGHHGRDQGRLLGRPTRRVTGHARSSRSRTASRRSRRPGRLARGAGAGARAGGGVSRRRTCCSRRRSSSWPSSSPGRWSRRWCWPFQDSSGAWSLAPIERMANDLQFWRGGPQHHRC